MMILEYFSTFVNPGVEKVEEESFRQHDPVGNIPFVFDCLDLKTNLT